MNSGTRVNWEWGVVPFCGGVIRQWTLLLVEEEEEEEEETVLEARVCMQDSTTLDTPTSLVRPQSFCLKELIDSYKKNNKNMRNAFMEPQAGYTVM